MCVLSEAFQFKVKTKYKNNNLFNILVIIHAISTVDTEQVPAGLCAGPVHIPIIVRADLVPVPLLAVGHHHRLVQVRAICHSHLHFKFSIDKRC